MIALSEDDYVRYLQDDRKTPVWVAELSDGTTAYMDDERPGLEEPSAWRRLRRHVYDNQLRIVSLWLKFRSNNNKGCLQGSGNYYFSKSVGAFLDGGDSLTFYKIGLLTNQQLMVQTWRVPELLHMENRELDATTYQAKNFLI